MTGAQPGFLLRFEQVVEDAAAILTGVSAVLIFVGVILRNLFDLSPSWVIEAPIYTFVWAVFLVLGGTFQRGLHLGLDVIVAGLPARLRSAFALFCLVAMGATAAMLVWLGTRLTFEQYAIGAISNTALKMPLYTVTAAMPIGFALLFLRAVVDILTFRHRAAAAAAAPPDASL
jgi:TRAP-type C4-dicarboxylate transport system permease small subunit